MTQSPCPCVVCSRDEPTGCYGSDDQRASHPEQACFAGGCECWGGEDRECEACWIDGK